MYTFEWLNQSSLREEAGVLSIQAPPASDFFNYGMQLNAEGIPDETVANAPYYYTRVNGDFVLRVKVTPSFAADYDACAIMIRQDANCWAKLCFEQTDFGTRAVVSVVTRVRSDDANGCNVDADSLWLQVSRVGDLFAFHYSLDNKRYDMVRFFHLETDGPLMVGLVAQSPVGQGGVQRFKQLSIEPRTVQNLRKGE